MPNQCCFGYNESAVAAVSKTCNTNQHPWLAVIAAAASLLPLHTMVRYWRTIEKFLICLDRYRIWLVDGPNALPNSIFISQKLLPTLSIIHSAIYAAPSLVLVVHSLPPRPEHTEP